MLRTLAQALVALTLPVTTLLNALPASAAAFRLERVEQGSVGAHTALALDADRNPHMAYWDFSNFYLKYATRENGVWSTEIVEATGFVGNEISVEIDAAGQVHMSYNNFAGGANILRYAVRSGGAWTIETADSSASDLGRHSSLELDTQGNPHISYYDATNTALKYAVKSGGWSVETVTAADDRGQYSSLALDLQGNPVISYYDDIAAWAGLSIARKLNGTWSLRQIDYQPIVDRDVGRFTSIAIDPQGGIHISYYDAENADLQYAFLRDFDDPPQLETVTGGLEDVGEYTSIALDSRANPHIAYYHTEDSALEYAVKSGPWQITRVDESVTVGEFASLALDEEDSPYIAYRDATEGSAKFADGGLQLLAPQAGDNWFVGSTRTLEWRGLGPVDIYLSVDGGNSFTKIFDDIAGGNPLGSFDMVVPHRPSRFCVLEIQRSSPFASARTDSFFTIETSVSLLSIGMAPSASGRGVDVSWRTDPGPDDLAGYRLERHASGSTWVTIVPLTRALTHHDPDGTPASRYRLFAVNGLGFETLVGSVDGGASALRSRLDVWPNPWSGGEITIAFATPAIGFDAVPIDVSVFDLSGRLVKHLASGRFPPGAQTRTWDGRDEEGRALAPGVYLVRSTSELFETSRKLVIE